MRKIVLQLAVSLDGYIEGPAGEFDWCFADGDYGMTDFLKRIDAIFIGRKSYELALSLGGATPPGFPEITEYVFSNSLEKVEANRVIIRGDFVETVNQIRNQPGKDIWLYGGAALTSSFINMGLVDEMILAVHPILLGAGKPLFEKLSGRIILELISAQTYPSGLVMLSYKLSK